MHIPGWYEQVKPLVSTGQLVLIGRIQEQHPERCQLFMQWQQMNWPVAIDPLNLLELSSIPRITAINEYGLAHPVTQENFTAEFIHKHFTPPHPPVPVQPPHTPDLAALKAQTTTQTAAAWGAYGAALYLWERDTHINDAIAAFRQAVALEDTVGRWHFRLGVCLRQRYDSPYRQATDFQEAIAAWGQALALEPNQYIWRRRIQQYGPRLDKPYPFYDWIHTARLDIKARGELPLALSVEPAGAEYAAPLSTPLPNHAAATNPDPNGQITRDERNFIQVEVITVPAQIKPGGSARIHLVFQPNTAAQVHWNNEVEDLQFWLDASPGWASDQALYTIASPPNPVSTERRRLDFEVRHDPKSPDKQAVLQAYALYYICEEANGVCMYRRQDIRIPLPLDQD